MLKNGVVAIAFRFLGQQQVNSHSSRLEFSSASAKKRAVRNARQGIWTKQETKTWVFQNLRTLRSLKQLKESDALQNT